MIVKDYIRDFENLGLGMFVHFGLYSVLGQGEWVMNIHQIPKEEYRLLAEQFNPKSDWANELVKTAKRAGCKYITLTTRHHDGFSLYDTCGLSAYDAAHTKCGRDLVREFVDVCRAEDIIPFFYHTLLDWDVDSFEEDFSQYLKYLRDSVEILCKNYGKIGGLWFDGMWSKPNDDWEEDALYGLIRKYQPEAMIINNTGLSALGALGHIELDSVTFERGKPQPLNMEGAPKYVASEMCEVFGNHWGYAKNDLNYKSIAQMIEEIADCRRCGSNMLINIGPMGDGSVRQMDEAMLGMIGQWVSHYEEAIRTPKPTGITIMNRTRDFLLKDSNSYYMFCYDLPVSGDYNVVQGVDSDYIGEFELPHKIKSITWMENGESVEFSQKGELVKVTTKPFMYGNNFVVRIAKIECE